MIILKTSILYLLSSVGILLTEPAIECMRGEPEPAISQEIFPNRTFQLTDKTSAIETIIFDNGDKLTVEHGGCEYFVQRYLFEISDVQEGKHLIESWYKKIPLLLAKIEHADDSPANISKGKNAIINYIDDYSEKKLGDEIDFGNEFLPESVVFEKVTQKNKIYTLEIVFTIGPL